MSENTTKTREAYKALEGDNKVFRKACKALEGDRRCMKRFIEKPFSAVHRTTLKRLWRA